MISHNVIGEENYKLGGYTDKVAIHDLYANMQFWFSYPMSETQSYYLLQDCLVALFYQLYFLECQTYWEYKYGYGWGWCKYGDGVDGKGCTSWICPEAVTKGKEYADAVKEKNEVEKQKKEKKKEQKDVDEAWGKVNEAYQKVINQTKCGQNGQQNPSPLQAFLCDCLKGFTCEEVMEGKSGSGKESGKEYQENLKQLREGKEKDIETYTGAYPEFLSHRGHPTVPGTECAVPMGFSGSFREGGPASGSKDGMIGLGIYGVLKYYTHWSVSDCSLYQITRCICSLTRRVPRSTGTLYGFFQGIISVYGSGQGPKGGGATEFKEALLGELAKETFGLQGSVTLMKALEEWKTKTGTHSTSGSCCSLDSLSGCEEGSKAQSDTSTCGKYLHPLTGSLYNSVATQYCDTYLSWILYLTWRLRSGLESLRDAFARIDCSKSGCKSCNGSGAGGSCHGGNGGNHGTEMGKCSCDNIVVCSGVYPVFYRFGFSIHGPSALTGKDTKGGGQNAIRKCHDFYQQLKKVIDGDLFSDLLKQISAFLYTTRLPFTLMIFGFWSIVLVYLLWSMTYNLDLIHIQSHWRSPRSYLVPLQRILADGSRKGICRLKYFGEGTGNGLLEMNDLYL